MVCTVPYQIIDLVTALRDLRQALESVRLNNWFAGSTVCTGSFPATNFISNRDDYVIMVELPGVNKSDVDVNAQRDQITISGKQRHLEKHDGVAC